MKRKMKIEGGKFMIISGHGFDAVELPIKTWETVRKLLKGAVIQWEDEQPLYDVGTVMDFAFDTKARAGADVYIARALGIPLNRIGDKLSRLLVGFPFPWHCRIEVLYSYKNRVRDDKAIVRPVEFKFKGTINPICDDYIDKRDRAFFAAQLEEIAVPDSAKNKGEYLTTRFTLTLL